MYPAEGTGSGNWESAYQKAKEFVGKLSAEEKVNLTAGVSVENGCSGNIAPIERLGFPGFCVSDAGNGLVSLFCIQFDLVHFTDDRSLEGNRLRQQLAKWASRGSQVRMITSCTVYSSRSFI
jgi:hypothetical protein